MITSLIDSARRWMSLGDALLLLSILLICILITSIMVFYYTFSNDYSPKLVIPAALLVTLSSLAVTGTGIILVVEEISISLTGGETIEQTESGMSLVLREWIERTITFHL